jgi:hypothetical protein
VGRNHGRSERGRFGLRHRPPAGGARKQTRQTSTTVGSRDSLSLHESEGDLHFSANTARVGGSNQGEYSTQRKYLHHRVSTDIELPRSAATFTDNTTISYDSSSTAASPLRRTTCFLVTTWTEASNHWKPSASFWRTRSNTQRISSSFEATTNALQSTAFMASTTSARGGTISNYGRPSQIASTACPSQQSLTRRYSPCTVG